MSGYSHCLIENRQLKEHVKKLTERINQLETALEQIAVYDMQAIAINALRSREEFET